METRIDEIGANVYRLSVFVPDVAPPAGFTYNHFLILGDEPLVISLRAQKDVPTGIRRCFQDHPRRSVALADLRPLRSGRVRIDERMACGCAKPSLRTA